MASIYDNMTEDEVKAYRAKLTELRNKELDRLKAIRDEARAARDADRKAAYEKRMQEREAAKQARDQAREAAKVARDQARNAALEERNATFNSLLEQRNSGAISRDDYSRLREEAKAKYATARDAATSAYTQARDAATSAYTEAYASLKGDYDGARSEIQSAYDTAIENYKAARGKALEEFALKRADASLGLRYVRDMQRQLQRAGRTGNIYQKISYQDYLNNLLGQEREAFNAQEAQRQQEAQAQGQTYTPQEFNSQYLAIQKMYRDMGQGIGQLPQDLVQTGPTDMPAQQVLQQQQPGVVQPEQVQAQGITAQGTGTTGQVPGLTEQPAQQITPMIYGTQPGQQVPQYETPMQQQQQTYNPYMPAPSQTYNPYETMYQQQQYAQPQLSLMPNIGYASPQYQQPSFNPMALTQQYNPYMAMYDMTSNPYYPPTGMPMQQQEQPRDETAQDLYSMAPQGFNRFF